jgi:hypothetical protein
VIEDEIDRLLSALPDDWAEALLWYRPDDPTGEEPARAAFAALLVDEPPAAPAGAETYLALFLRRDPDGAAGDDRQALREALDALEAEGHPGRLTRVVPQRRGVVAR